ncbi:MAG: hypothetical protein H0V42_04755 [Nocardioidaceae bacterium]|nr:hypothetical protein [Nocardioidaceae bacterium]
MLLTSEPFVAAEIEYRHQRAVAQFNQGRGTHGRRRQPGGGRGQREQRRGRGPTIKLPRRPTIKLPQLRRPAWVAH